MFPLGSKPRTIRAANLRLTQDSYRVVPKPAIGRSVPESRRMDPSGMKSVVTSWVTAASGPRTGLRNVDPALIFLDITPATPADQEKLAHALQVLTAADAGLRARQGVDSGCTVIGATSGAHLEQVVDRLAREFRIEASVGRPAIAYKETLTRSSEGVAKYVTHARPTGEFAYVACDCIRAPPRAATASMTRQSAGPFLPVSSRRSTAASETRWPAAS